MTSNDIVSAAQANILLKEATQCYIDRNYAPALVKFENAYNILFTIKILRRKNIIDIGLLLMNWSGALIQTHDYHYAIKRGEESWGYLNNNLIINDSGLDLARANLMSNLSTAYISIGRVYAAYEKLELSDQLFKKISGDQPSSDHCMMLMHWAMAYEKEHLFSNALEKYQEAFSRWPGIKVAELCYDNSLATLYLNWGIVCNTLDRTDDALQKLNQSWIIRGVNLALDPKYEIGRVKILSSLANVYSKLQRYNEAEEKHADALKRLSKPGFKDTPEANFERTIILANMAGDRIERLDAESAIKAYETALLNTDREEDLLKINNQLGVAYLEQKNYAKALDLLLASKKKLLKLASREHPITDQLGEVCMNIGSCYLEMAQPQKALVEIDSGVEYYKKYAAAKGEYFDVNICSAMSNRAAILRDIGRHDDALAEINSAINYLNIKKSILLSPKEWQLLCGLYIRASSVYLEIKNADSALFHAKKSLALIENKNSATEHDEIAKSISWTQVANALQMSKHYEQAAEAYGKADFYRSKKIDQSRIIDDSASIYVNWARSLYMANRDEDAIKLFRKSYDWLSKAPSTPSRDHQLFLLVQNWQYCWSTMPDGQGWAREVSAELCRRLSEQNLANPPHKLVELHRRFTQFHLRWMQDSLRDGYPKHIVEILSRFSSWRMATALLDELETIAPAADGEEGSRTLQHYQRTRLEVRRLQQRLQEKEVAAGRSGTDFSGVLGFSLDGSKRSAKAQARLDAEINILRNEYDYVYTEMQQAQAKAALVPGYTALSIDRSSLDSHRLQQSLADKQALLIIFDHETDGDKSESAEKIGGALLLQRDSVHWHPLNDIAMGSAFLHKFEYFVGENRGDLRGSESLRIDYLKKTSVKVESTFYGDFRRGDMPKIDEEEKHDPLVYQGRIINQFNLWNSLGDWVKDVLWNPILQKGLLEGIEELVLVTQGQQSHSIPWQMGTQVKSEAIRRYPGLIFYAMDAGLMSRANCSNEPTLGIAHYQGSNRSLPFARIEAEVLGQIWTKSGRKALQDFDYLNPQLSVGIVHVAGHGSHAPEPNQAATACLSVGKHTNWGLAQLMSSQARPSQVYLSCCVAGRTTDLAGEQYGVTAALLQHGTREVVASSVSLNDLWGATLSIITHSLMRQQGLPMREALHQAQAMVTERQAWDETAWAWVTKGWIMRLDEVMQEYLLPLIRGLQTKSFAMSSDQKLANSLRDKMRIDVYTNIPHINLIKFDDQKRAEWELALARELRTHSGLADESTLMSMVQKYTNTFHQTLTWLTQAPPLITGSLVFATAVFG